MSDYYSTGFECIFQSQKLAASSNIKLDAGAASIFFHVVWNNPVKFKRVLTYLGDFHGMLELFSMIGKIVQRSSFKDIVYQTSLILMAS